MSNSDFLIEDGVLTQYNGPGGNVVIPEGVTEIGDKAFSGCTNLTGVTLPASITKIGAWAFLRCEKLTSVSIPEGVEEIARENSDRIKFEAL